MKVERGDNQNYKLLVKLVKVKTGEGIYVKTVPASAEFEISFVETSTGKVLAKGRTLNAKGIVKTKTNMGGTGSVMRVVARTMNTDVANRMAQCYDSAAMITAKYVLRFNKKKKKKQNTIDSDILPQK